MPADNWVQLHTGNRFSLDGGVLEVSIYDIARQLSRIPRFNGATQVGCLSVAEHSIATMEITRETGGSERQQLAALLHDAHEIVFGDVPGPVKALIKKEHGVDLDKVAAPFQAQIELKLGIDPLPEDQYELVSKADLIALAVERRLFMPSRHVWQVDAIDPPQDYDGFYVGLEPDDAKNDFLNAYEFLRSDVDLMKRIAEHA